MKYAKLLRLEQLIKQDISSIEALIAKKEKVCGIESQGYRKNSALHLDERLRRKQLSVVQDLIWGYPIPRPSHFPVDPD